MIDDPVRIAAFERGIRAAVRAGDVVVDLGCALGNYAVLACAAGAARVYAVEAGPVAVAARQVVAANGCDDRIRVLRGLSTELAVPERAGVVIYEDYPITLVSTNAARVTRDAVERWLRPGGRMLPSRARLWAAPVEAEDAYREIDRFAAVGDRVAGVDIGPTRHLAFCETVPVQLPASAPLGEARLVAELDLQPLREPVVDFETRVAATRPGLVHGLLLWFELELAGEWLSSGPLSPRVAWRQALFPAEQPLRVDAGQEIAVSLRGGPFGDEMVWHWCLEAGGQRGEASTLDSMSLDAERLARWEPGRVPRRDAEQELHLAILQLVDGARPLAQIASELEARFPGRFDQRDLARRRVLEVLERSRSRARPDISRERWELRRG